MSVMWNPKVSLKVHEHVELHSMVLRKGILQRRGARVIDHFEHFVVTISIIDAARFYVPKLEYRNTIKSDTSVYSIPSITVPLRKPLLPKS